MINTIKNPPYLGFGLGLRTKHYAYILEHKPPLDWLEVVSENYFSEGGRPLYYLDEIRAHYSMVMHGVSLSVGGTDPIDMVYLRQLKQLAARIEPAWISDHLCWIGISGQNSHDLLPLPYTQEALEHVVSRVQQIQEFLQQRILLENPSSYLNFQQADYKEWDFLAAVAEQADCLILLDINNIYVSAQNHDFNPHDYLNAMPVARVQQFHLAGHKDYGTHVIDTHGELIIDPVWDLYMAAVQRFGEVSTMIERDEDIPEFPVLWDELQQAKAIAQRILAEEPA
ncbi:MAG: DUF692 domain-containing protein [Gammaproteobacteria bacterium]